MTCIEKLPSIPGVTIDEAPESASGLKGKTFDEAKAELAKHSAEDIGKVTFKAGGGDAAPPASDSPAPEAGKEGETPAPPAAEAGAGGDAAGAETK